MLTRPCMIGAIFLALLAIVFWDRLRIRSLKAELASKQISVVGPMVRPDVASPGASGASTTLAATSQIEAAETDIPTVGPIGDTMTESSLEQWLQRVDRLKTWLEQKPELKIPELDFANNEDWLFATYHNRLENEDDFRRAYSFVLAGVETRINSAIVAAMHSYEIAKGVPAAEVEQILPYLAPPIGDLVLKHYERTASPRGLNLRSRSAGR